MKAIIRREFLNYLKRPLFWIAIVVVMFGVFQQLNPYLNIHYITSEEELENEYPETVHEGEVFEGYIPVNAEEHRELWENVIEESLVSDFGMSNDEASSVIQKMSGMEINEACRYLEDEYGYYKAQWMKSMLISKKNWKNIHFPGTFPENLQILQGCLWVLQQRFCLPFSLCRT